MTGSDRQRTCAEGEVAAAIRQLTAGASRVDAKQWPVDRDSADAPGLYAWWIDAGGASDLAAGLGQPVAPGLLYAGLTGATKWPSGKVGTMTLKQRILRNHLGGTTRGSTFRWSLASVLRDELELQRVGPRRIAVPSEARLTEWMLTHLRVSTHAYPDRDRLADLEDQVLEQLDPPLNLDGMAKTLARMALSARRRW